METDIITGEKPPEVLQAESVMLKQFQTAEPELKGQIRPEESVRKSLEVIGRLDAKTSGLLLSHNGIRGRWL
jgi:16S rRNA U516 pseudouridylate synthase RsuA-like enzyme